MSFDGVVIKSISSELNNKLVGAKIDKVYQPERDEICLKIRGRNENYKLVISASASIPRIYLAKEYEKSNPKKAPVFCMTLRKYIQNGVITSVEQIDFERVIRISVDSYDELREKTTKYLYVEVMGKHSNIILVSKNENRIIDSIKRIPLSVSRMRQILPGMDYELPPKQDKINPLEVVDKEILMETMESLDIDVVKGIYSSIGGFSPLISREICSRLNIKYEMSTKDLFLFDYKRISDEINSIISDLKNNEIIPNLILDESKDKIVEFSSIYLGQYKDYTSVQYESLSDTIEQYYKIKAQKEHLKQKYSGIKKSLSLKLERVNNKILKQKKELKEAENADIYKIKGELITSYIFMIERGMKSVELENFYDENKKISIQLDEKLSPSENAQKYFKKYNKLKKAAEELTKFLVENIEEAEYLENTILSIDNCESVEELKEIKEELIREGYVRSFKMPKKDNKPSTEFRKYISSNGNLIIVGKNNKQNDYLTLRLADNEDLWFHTKDIPGSHVLLKAAGKSITDDEIREAALLAAYHSKAKLSSKVPVDYTIKKNVKKPSGAKPGMVIYEKNKTIYITPDQEEITKIKKITS